MSVLPALATSVALNAIGSDIASMHSRQLMKYQQQLNNESWQQYTDYMSPSNQIERMKHAGLNPDLAYGNVQMSLGQSSATGLGSGSGDASGGLSALAQFKQIKQQQAIADAQVRNIDADTHLKNEQANELTDFRDEKHTGMQYDNFFKSIQATTEYQKGVETALRNFANGYRPNPDESSGDVTFGDVYHHLDSANSIIEQIADERELLHYDVKYMRELFSDMVKHDKEQFDHDKDEWRKHSKVLKALNDNEWMQFIDYFVDKLSSNAQRFGSAYVSFRKRD